MVIDHVKLIELDCKCPVRAIRSDNGTIFKNAVLNDFCADKGITRKYSAPQDSTAKWSGTKEESYLD